MTEENIKSAPTGRYVALASAYAAGVVVMHYTRQLMGGSSSFAEDVARVLIGPLPAALVALLVYWAVDKLSRILRQR